MTSTPVPLLLEVAGRNFGVYEDLYKEADPHFRGVISASDAASLLKRSKLGNAVLGKIWDLADSERRGCLDKTGLFVAFKLVALAQNGQEPVLANLKLDIPPPNLLVTGSACASPIFPSMYEEWIIKPADQEKYIAIFESLGPEGGKLSGDKVKPVLLNSGLPNNVLGKIWGLSDMDRDGYLDRDEMCVALHLVYRALENDPIPSILPLNMVPHSKRHLSSTAGSRKTSVTGGVPVLPPPFPGTPRSRTSSVTSVESLGMVGPSLFSVGQQPVISSPSVPVSASGTSLERRSPSLGGGTTSRSLSGTPTPMSTPVKPPVPWIVDKYKWEATFTEADKDMDGLVSGADIKMFLVQSGLAQNYLAHIWSLVDLKKTGTLNLEQFALAMHLIEQKKENNMEPPASLPPDLIPPSFRPPAAGMTDMGTSTQERVSGGGDSLAGSSDGGNKSSERAGPSSGNKEIDALMEEIQNLQTEKRNVDQAVVQLEADMTVKQSEIKNLEVESTTLESTVNQLDRQKGEANRRLSDLDMQKESLQKTLRELNEKLDSEQQESNALKMDIEQSNMSAQSQEDELNRKRAELASLREEENRMEVKLQMEKANLDTAAQQHGSLERQIQQVEWNFSKLREHTSTVREKLNNLESIISAGNVETLEKEEMSLLAALQELRLPSLGQVQKQGSWKASGYQENTFALSGSSFPSYYDTVTDEKPSFGNVSTSSPYPMEDPFKKNDPFAWSGGLANGADPFTSSDPFAGSSSAPGFSSDPFAPTNSLADPFASTDGGVIPSGGSANPSPNDPFAPQSTEKKAPPRPVPPKGRPTTPKTDLQSPGDPFKAKDPFGSSATTGAISGFANFADFANFS